MRRARSKSLEKGEEWGKLEECYVRFYRGGGNLKAAHKEGEEHRSKISPHTLESGAAMVSTRLQSKGTSTESSRLCGEEEGPALPFERQ